MLLRLTYLIAHLKTWTILIKNELLLFRSEHWERHSQHRDHSNWLALIRFPGSTIMRTMYFNSRVYKTPSLIVSSQTWVNTYLFRLYTPVKDLSYNGNTLAGEPDSDIRSLTFINLIKQFGTDLNGKLMCLGILSRPSLMTNPIA